MIHHLGWRLGRNGCLVNCSTMNSERSQLCVTGHLVGRNERFFKFNWEGFRYVELTFCFDDFIGMPLGGRKTSGLPGRQGKKEFKGFAFDLTFSTAVTRLLLGSWKPCSSGSRTDLDNYRVTSEL